MAHQLPVFLSTRESFHRRYNTKISNDFGHLRVFEMITPKFPEDGRSVAPKAFRNHIYAHFGSAPCLNLAPFFQAQLLVGCFRGISF